MPDQNSRHRKLASDAAGVLFSLGSYRVARRIIAGGIVECYEVLDITLQQIAYRKRLEL